MVGPQADRTEATEMPGTAGRAGQQVEPNSAAQREAAKVGPDQFRSAKQRRSGRTRGKGREDKERTEKGRKGKEGTCKRE